MPVQRPPWRRHLTVLLLYLALSLLLTYPLVTRITTHVPGDGIDDPALAWNLWWIKFSLVDRQINPFTSGWMFYPLGINLAFYTLTVLNGLLSVPLQTALGLVTASNLVLLSSFVLSGYGAYLLALTVLAADRAVLQGRQSNNRGIADSAAFLAGVLYAFASSKLFYAALGQFNIASSQWIPFAVLYALRSGRSGARLREPLLAGLFLLLQAYAELTYASFLVIFMALFAGYRLAQDRGQARRLLRNFAVLALVFALGLLPILANMLPDMRNEGDFLAQGSGFADIFSADLAGYALPTQLHPVLGHVVRQAANNSLPQPDGDHWPVDKGQHLTLGFAGLALALVGLWAGRKRPDVWFWALAAATFFLLTLGPTARVAGHDTGIPGPFRLLQGLPFFEGNRYPSRYSVMLLVSVAPLTALGAEWLLRQLKARWQNRRSAEFAQRGLVAASALLAGLLIFENLSIPLPSSDMRIPALYDVVAADQGDFAVLDLPLGWRNGFDVFGKQDVIIMSEQWWQTRHGKPILGGNTSRNPEHKFRYFLEAPLIGPLSVLANATDANSHIRDQLAPALAALRAGDPGLGGNALLQQAAADATETLSQLGARYVVIHRDHAPPELATFVETYLPVTRLVEEGEHVLYAVELPPAPSELTIRPALDALSRGEGWSSPGQVQVDDQISPWHGRPLDQGTPRRSQSLALWAQRRQTRLLLPPIQPGPYRLSVRAAAAGPGQTLALTVNGLETAAQPLGTDWSELVFDLPAGVLKDGANELLLRFGQTFPVEQIMPQGASLLIESAGLEAGNYGHIWLNGRDISPNGRGYNLAIIDGQSWQPAAVASFDTHLDPAASQAMVEFLRQMDADSVLAVAVKDTAGDQLSAEAAQALARLGLADLGGRLRWGQAAIVLGDNLASPGQRVFEQASGLQSVSVGVGPGWREPQAAAVVESVHVAPLAE